MSILKKVPIKEVIPLIGSSELYLYEVGDLRLLQITTQKYNVICVTAVLFDWWENATCLTPFSSCLSRIPSLYVISCLKGEIRPHPLFLFSCESLPHYPDLTTRPSLTKLTLNKNEISLWSLFRRAAPLDCTLKHFFSLQLSWQTPKQEQGWDFFCDGHWGPQGFLVRCQVSQVNSKKGFIQVGLCYFLVQLGFIIVSEICMWE